jgi:hypothetical protein
MMEEVDWNFHKSDGSRDLLKDESSHGESDEDTEEEDTEDEAW